MHAELCQTWQLLWLQGAQAIADVILGKVSPSARLPMSFYYSNYTRQARPLPHFATIHCGAVSGLLMGRIPGM